MLEQALGLRAKAAEEEDEVGFGGVGREGVARTVRGACGQKGDEFGLVDGSEMNLHGELDFIVLDGGKGVEQLRSRMDGHGALGFAGLVGVGAVAG